VPYEPGFAEFHRRSPQVPSVVYGLYRRMQPTNQRPSLGGTGTGGEAEKRPSAGLAQVCYLKGMYGPTFGRPDLQLDCHVIQSLKSDARFIQLEVIADVAYQ
jgi:hypothetical protein